MSKGSLFWSKASGKLGEVVLSQVKGQQISRAYQPKVTNPRSSGQTIQRIRFSNAVKFYKHATQALFKFAYEDKRQNESDYNAFMRKNANVAAYVKRESYLNQFYPAIGNQFLLADGSLPSLPFGDGKGALKISLGTKDFANPQAITVAELSSRFIELYNFAEGDILTFVYVSNEKAKDITSEPQKPTQWLINQIVISSTDTTTVTDVFKAQNGQTFASGAASWLVSGETGQEKTLYVMTEETVEQGWVEGAALIQSRRVAGQKLLVSRSYLVNNKYANDIYKASMQSAYVNQALNSWGRTQDAILQGGLAKNL